MAGLTWSFSFSPTFGDMIREPRERDYQHNISSGVIMACMVPELPHMRFPACNVQVDSACPGCRLTAVMAVRDDPDNILVATHYDPHTGEKVKVEPLLDALTNDIGFQSDYFINRELKRIQDERFLD